MANEWDIASGNRALAVKEMRKLIPTYEYSDKGTVAATNDQFCKIMLEKLRRSKSILFNIINTCYEMHHEDDLKGYDQIKDELDIFLDEIKVLMLKWKNLSRDWLEKIIRHDLNLIKDSDKLAENIEAVFKEIVGTSRNKRDNKFWKKIEAYGISIEKQLDGIVRMFKERETLLNLKAMSLEKTYKAARKEISEKI